MSSNNNKLSHFLSKQVDRATRRLIDRLSDHRLIVEMHGQRLLIIELLPHPANGQDARIPFALLDYKPDGWVLLFRGTEGHWQPLPNDVPQLSIDSKIEAIIQDDYGVFWRQ